MSLMAIKTLFDLRYRPIMSSNKGVKLNGLVMDYQQLLYAIDGNCLALIKYHAMFLDRKTAGISAGCDPIIT